MCFYLKMLTQFHVVLFYTRHCYIIRLHFTLTRTHEYTLYFNIIYMCLYVFLCKNFDINFIFYIFCTGPYNTICLHFTLITTCGYAFYSNVIYMCLYLHVFIFKNFNINFTLYIFCT